MIQRGFFLIFLSSLCLLTSPTSWAAGVCGDGYLLDSEECDDGNTINESCPYGATQCDICDQKCRITQGDTQTCGDGIVQESFETCDNQGVLELDCEYGLTSCELCLPHCELGLGRVSFCGDGEIDGRNGEFCDPNHPDFITCPYGDARCQTCTTECKLQEIVGPFCGDDIIQDEEDCDDGNNITERCPTLNPTCQICNSQCQWEQGDGSFCGDGTVDAQWNEVCDDGESGIASCPYGETCEYCNDDCVFETITGPSCGDGLIQTQNNENCDDGNNLTDPCPYGEASCLICNANCQLQAGQTSYCGDLLAQTQFGEQCDTGGDDGSICNYGQESCIGCDDTCQWAVFQGSFCGDGIVNESLNETCDDGNAITELCDYETGPCTVCDSTCQWLERSGAACGDGEVNVSHGETCDDGNTETEDCPYNFISCNICNSECQWAPGATAYCGDGIHDYYYEEVCDEGSQAVIRCDYGSATCLACDNTCRYYIATGPYCGDGRVQTENGETCDPGSGVSNECPYGAQSCNVCTETCQNQPGQVSYCGDGVLQPTFEECDSFPRAGADCAYNDPFCEVCNHLCQRVSAQSPLCGDGVIDSEHGETCDDGNTFTEACLYSQKECSVCNDTCQWVTGATAYCGDGEITQDETCEDGNTYTEACADYNESCTVCNAACQNGEGLLRFCGDGVVDAPQENCDLGDQNGNNNCAYGVTSCDTCTAACEESTGTGPFCGDGLRHESEACDDALDELLPQGSCSQCSIQCVDEGDWRFYIDQNNDHQDGCEEALWGKSINLVFGNSLVDLQFDEAGQTFSLEEHSVNNERVSKFISWNNMGDIETSLTFQSQGETQTFATELSRLELKHLAEPWILGHACIAEEENSGLPCELVIEGNSEAPSLELTSHPLGTPFILQVSPANVTIIMVLTPTSEASSMNWGADFVSRENRLLPLNCGGTFSYGDSDADVLDCTLTSFALLDVTNATTLFTHYETAEALHETPLYDRLGQLQISQTQPESPHARWRVYSLQGNPSQLVTEYDHQLSGDGLEFTFLSSALSATGDDWRAYKVNNTSEQPTTLSLAKCISEEGTETCTLETLQCFTQELEAQSSHTVFINAARFDDCSQQFMLDHDISENMTHVQLFAGTTQAPIGAFWTSSDEGNAPLHQLQYPLSNDGSLLLPLNLGSLYSIEQVQWISEDLFMLTGEIPTSASTVPLDLQENNAASFNSSNCMFCESKKAFLKLRRP